MHAGPLHGGGTGNGFGHSPALQLAGVHPTSKQKMEKAVTTCQAWQYWKKEGKGRESGGMTGGKEGRKENNSLKKGLHQSLCY